MYAFAPDTRISVDFNQRMNEWSLIIQDVRPLDEGVYQCQISTKNEHDTYDIKLNVKSTVSLSLSLCPSLYVRMAVRLPLCMCGWVSLRPSLCFCVVVGLCLCVWLSVCPSECVAGCLLVCPSLSVRMAVYLSV